MLAANAAGFNTVFPIDGDLCSCQTNWTTGEYHDSDCPEAKKLRDAWCTPESLAKRLPMVDLDPASNERSKIRARKSLWLERGEDGLAVPWTGSIFLNGPYSDMLPWANKAVAEWNHGLMTEAMFLVKLDPTTTWWKTLTLTQDEDELRIWLFNKRLQHDPPPRIKASTNNFASALIHWRDHNKPDLGLDDIARCFGPL